MAIKKYIPKELSLSSRSNASAISQKKHLATSEKLDALPTEMKHTALQKEQQAIQRMIKESSHMRQLKSKQEVIIQRKNNTNLPDALKNGMEKLSGIAMDDVKVHYNSSQPAKLKAHAYAQGNQIYLGAGQEKHLAHEAWHVIQQKQGRVKPTLQRQGLNINDNAALEKEADVMGQRSMKNEK